MQQRKSSAGENGAAATKENTDEAHKNRPEDTKFKQQRLDAWQPILTPRWVIGTFIVVGVVFVPIGVYLLSLSNDLFEAKVTYDSHDANKISSKVSESCRISNVNQGYDELVGGSRGFQDCELEFTFDRDIAEDEIVYVYYEIENFYQNHRRYVKSVSESQLSDLVSIPSITTLTDSSLKTACDPPKSFSNEDAFDRIYYPCGLIALSVFNDGISLKSISQGENVVEYSAGIPNVGLKEDAAALVTQGIAWESDLQNKYRNPTQSDCGSTPSLTGGGNLCPTRYFQYQFLWQTYNQFVCYPVKNESTGAPDLSAPQSPCVDYTTYVRELGSSVHSESSWDSFVSGNSKLSNSNEFVGACAKCENPDDILVSAGGVLPPSDTTSAESAEGLRDERFIVWMRTAGLPTFRKLYGHLRAPLGGFKKGDTISLTVIPNFLVSTISGSKSIILGTTSPLGGKNDILGIAYIAVGSICLALACLFALKLKFHPRNLGDPKYLQWKKK